jgi:SMI1/KNR4 family protein SUKH-1
MGTSTLQVEPSWPSRLQAMVARCQEDAALHMTAGPCTENELRYLEDALGAALPSAYRAFLARVGGGVYYLRHEIFGAHRVMVHDIELLPDVLSFRHWLGIGVPPGLLPFHRAGARIHALALEGPDAGRVVVLEASARRSEAPPRSLSTVPSGDASAEAGYPDFVTFLEQVVRDVRD